MINIQSQLEAVIFSEGGEMLVKSICDVLGIGTDELTVLVQEYNEKENKGMVLVIDDKKVLMRVASEYAELIEKLRKDVQNEELSKAALEVLSIVLYSEGTSLSASEVEHIRGVNSGYTLRQLTMRGLLNKTRHGMGYHYAPTAELLSFLGITNTSALPEIAQAQEQLRRFQDKDEEHKI